MTDDDLRAHLRRADPAASLPPLPPARIAHLLEQTMATPFAGTEPVAPARTPARWRSGLLAAAAAVVLAGAAAGWFLLRPSTETDPSMSSLPTIVGHLTAPGVAAKCVEPTAEVLRSRADLAFAGTVRSVAGGVVTLDVTRVYLGEPVDEVEVTQTGGASETLLGSGKFEAGRQYLIAAADGTMLICGYSGDATALGLQAMYDEAF